ncbi:hypothetical protein VXG46_000294 [Acinetobacter baumannii]|uniref:Uncharacterized protein n=1 Tax=Acinetobacter baumannii TaxID=470 RepID=A0A505MLQ2_ACIBA|nr:hypothetical protein [Acinetobacter baumannii]EJB8494589.1 hypothetical protein [Acinetobacter baumannii]ELB0342930.1 hypothetical protein [Acinetobacter baumannii]EMC7949840.1 hypothetical protein [Acinetobacter baumannii]EMC7952924.1 hypothetical protein [Acinetobacter baumannii]EMD9691194.1 hypothetical protein [Acinetobacter baumannii]
MSETQQRQKHPRLLLNIVLIILETFFSFILTHDGVLRLQAKKFIANKITIRINSYLPFFDFYVQFTEKGLLFDIHSYDRRIDLEINSTLVDLIKIFVFSNHRSLNNMRIDGDAETKKELIDLISHLTLPKLLADWKQWFNAPDDEAEALASRKKIDQQRSEINSLHVEIKQYQNRIARLQQRQRNINLCFGIISLIFIVYFIYNLWVA